MAGFLIYAYWSVDSDHRRWKGICKKKHPPRLSLYRSVSIMIHRQRHKKGISESCWRGCLVKVHKTFTGHPLFCEKCRFQENMRSIIVQTNIYSWPSFGISAQESTTILVQFTKFALLGKKFILIGLEMSAFSSTLLIMEPTVGGECG